MCCRHGASRGGGRVRGPRPRCPMATDDHTLKGMAIACLCKGSAGSALYEAPVWGAARCGVCNPGGCGPADGSDDVRKPSAPPARVLSRKPRATSGGPKKDTRSERGKLGGPKPRSALSVRDDPCRNTSQKPIALSVDQGDACPDPNTDDRRRPPATSVAPPRSGACAPASAAGSLAVARTTADGNDQRRRG